MNEEKPEKQMKNKNLPDFQNDSSIYSNLELEDYKNHDTETVNEGKFEISNTRDIATIYANEIKTATHIEQLNSIINSMISKLNGIWTCTQCGKTDKCKRNLGNHVEGKHLKA